MKIINLEIMGLRSALVAAGYPMQVELFNPEEDKIPYVEVRDLVKKRARLGSMNIGSGNDCFLKGIIVKADINYTQYWSMQFQRYHFADIVSSQSKMHRITRMGVSEKNTNGYVDNAVMVAVNNYIARYNEAKRNLDDELAQEMFLYIMANVPMGLTLWMQITANYLQLKTIYSQRVNGDAKRLPEDWGVFCKWCEQLPFFMELCFGEKNGSK